MNTFDALIFIGRFQPFHLAHLQTVEIALGMSQRLIMVIGSAQDERTRKNPFTTTERQHMILNSLAPAQRDRICFVPIIDWHNDQKWCAAVKAGVAQYTRMDERIGLIGHFKDDSSYYLRLFPEWSLVELDSLQQSLSATPIREEYFAGRIDQAHLPTAVSSFLKDFQRTEQYQALAQSQ